MNDCDEDDKCCVIGIQELSIENENMKKEILELETKYNDLLSRVISLEGN
jgi:hypothetical protein